MNIFKNLFGKNTIAKEYAKTLYVCVFNGKSYDVLNPATGKVVRSFKNEAEMNVWIEIRRINKEKCVIAKVVYPFFDFKEE